MKTLLKAFCIIFLWSCAEQDPETMSIVCDNQPCDFENMSFETSNCAPVYFGDFNLSEKSIASFPDFEYTLNDTLSFVHQDSSLTYIVKEKKNDYGWVSYNSFDFCSCKNNTLFYCLYSDIRSIKFVNPADESSFFKLELQAIPDLTQRDLNSIGFKLSIIRDYLIDFEPVLDQSTLSSEMMRDQEKIDSVIIDHITYYDVITNRSGNELRQRYKYLYSPAFGLIGFTDLEGQFWKRI